MTRLQGFKLVEFLSLRLPRSMLYRVAHAITMVNYYVNRQQREAVHANLRVILGPTASKKRIRFEAKWTFRHFSKYIAEFFGYERFGEVFLDTHVHVVDSRHIDAALARGKGVALATAHLSNWELGAAWLARNGYPVVAVAMPHPDPRLNEMFVRQRASRGYGVIETEGGFRQAVRELRKNKIVCFAGDRDVGYGSTTVEFFGRPTPFPQGPARAALMSGAALLPAFVIRRPNGHFAAWVAPALPVPDKGTRREKAHVMTQEFACLVEKWVAMFPAQWGVFHKYWPDGREARPGVGPLG